MKISKLAVAFLSAALLMPQTSHAWFFFFIPGSMFTSSDKREVADLHKKADWNGLRDLAQKKIDSDATNADWWIQKGFANLRLLNYGEAAKSYSEAVRLQPSSYIAINDLGVVYQNQGKYKEALDQYQSALKVKPDFPLAMQNSARMQYRLGRPDLAWDMYQSLLQSEPARAKALKDQFLFTDVRPTPPASTAIASAQPSATPPQAPTTQGGGPAPSEQEQIGKANAVWDAKSYSELVTFAESWTLASSASPNSWYYLGLGHYGLGAKDKALPAFKEALRLKPDLPDTIAKFLTVRGDKARLQEVFSVLQELDPIKAQDFKSKYLAQR